MAADMAWAACGSQPLNTSKVDDALLVKLMSQMATAPQLRLFLAFKTLALFFGGPGFQKM
jgi:hypothetical protein